MSVIEVEPLTRAHLEAFYPEIPPPDPIPDSQLGNAAVLVIDGVPVAVYLAAATEEKGVATVAMLLTAEARHNPVSLYRTARRMLATLHTLGYTRITTGSDDERSARWLRHLGFEQEAGGFAKCLS